MTKIAIVYHSGHGHTKSQAEHVWKGSKLVGGVTCAFLTSEEATKDFTPLNEADCIIFGCPTYMGGPSAEFKKFIDAASGIWFKQGWKDKLAAGFTNSGSPSGDKLSTLSQLMINAMQHSMVWVGTGLMVNGDVNRLSSFVGAMAESPHGAPTPLEGDLKTAELFGKRVAEIALRWAR